MERTVNYYISTGQKQVLHTLWVERIIPVPVAPGEPEFAAVQYHYLWNLPANQDEAIAKAKEWIAQADPKANFLGITDSPRFKKAKFFDMYGMHFAQRRKAGKTFYMAEDPTPEFWDAWRANKDDMRKAGFRVSKFEKKYDKRMRRLPEPIWVWYVFYNPEEV